jgi:hypothetical protein
MDNSGVMLTRGRAKTPRVSAMAAFRERLAQLGSELLEPVGWARQPGTPGGALRVTYAPIRPTRSAKADGYARPTPSLPRSLRSKSSATMYTRPTE